MCFPEPCFQNGDCVLIMLSWGIRVISQIYALNETTDVLSECHFTENMLLIWYAEAWELTQCHNEINWHFYVSIDDNCVGCLQYHFSSPTENRMCGLVDCCKPLCIILCQAEVIRYWSTLFSLQCNTCISFEIKWMLTLKTTHNWVS